MIHVLDSCESGSLSEDLSKDLGILSIASSLEYECSWATNCPDGDVVDGKNIGACLGDYFSTNFMYVS